MKLHIPFVVAVLAATAFAQIPEPSEQGVVLNATEFLPAEALRGPSYRVREEVVTDGYMAHFELDTDYGTFTAVGVPQLRQRIVEVEALRKLAEVSKSDLFAQGLKRSVQQPVEAVKNIVANPVDSIKEAPKTVGHFFVKVGSSIGRGVTKTVDNISEGIQDPDTDAGEIASQTGKGIGDAARSAAGFESARLETAKQLGVDPYTDNKRLQQEMDKVTWAFFAGGLPLRVGAMVASAGTAVFVTKMVGIPEDTYALTKGELAGRDEASLLAMGVTLEDIKDFQVQSKLSVTRRHRIVTCLEAMSGATGRGNVVRLANSCTTTDQADFLVEALAVLAQRQIAGTASYTEIKVLGRLPGGVTRAGDLEVPAPVDYVTWTEQVANFSRRDDLGSAPKVLIYTGKLSRLAAAGIAASGWKSSAVPYADH